MDVLHDNSFRTWFKIGSNFAEIIPPYVWDYSLPDEKVASEMQDTEFADATRRLFPISTKEAAWMSAAYFAYNQGALPYKRTEQDYVLSRIKSAAVLHGITDDVDKVITTLSSTASQEKCAEAEVDSNYGWVILAEDGTVISRKYPMFDARGVKLAGDYFSENRAKYPLGIRRTIARNIMSKAAEFKVDQLPAAIAREAGYGLPRKDILMNEIYERAHMTKDAESTILLANINELLAGIPDDEIGQNLDKIAEVIDAFDHSTGLNRYYGKRLLMPADILFDLDIKTAEAVLEDSVELSQHMFSISKLAELPVGVFEQVLGVEFKQAVANDAGAIDRTKLADNLHSLPKPDKVALEEHLMRLFA